MTLAPFTTVLLLALAAAGATALGGVATLRLRGRDQLLAGLASGVVIGVALLDLAAEALEQGRQSYGSLGVLTAMACGFMAYLVLEHAPGLLAQGRSRAPLGPSSLVAHSLMDGLGIGVAYAASPGLGWMVAIAVVAHDVFDGVNTVTLSLNAGLSRPQAQRWLVADVGAPVMGVLLSRLVHAPPAVLAPLLGLFAGFFLYIGAVELLPRSQREPSGTGQLAAPVLGAGFIYLIVRLARG